MAKFQSLKLGEEYLLKLSRLEQNADSIIKQAVYQGAKVVGDAIKGEAEALPVEPFRKLGPGEAFTGVTPEEKEAIVQGFGLSDMEQDRLGWNTKAGFAGYVTRQKTKKYPKGTPVPMLVRSIESGSSVQLPVLYQDLTDWAVWDGVSEVPGETGQQVVVAEVDAIGLCMGAGSATVTAKAGG